MNMKFRKGENNPNWKGGISFEIKEYRVKWWIENREKLKESRKQYQQEHHKEIVAHRKEYYMDNKEKVKERIKQFKAPLKQYIRDYKLSKGCSICGYKKCASALVFHHVNGNKEFDMFLAANRKLEITKKEIEKCIVLCANCHMELHAKEREGDNEQKSL